MNETCSHRPLLRDRLVSVLRDFGDFTVDQLAAMLSTHRERVRELLLRLRRKGVVEYAGCFKPAGYRKSDLWGLSGQ